MRITRLQCLNKAPISLHFPSSSSAPTPKRSPRDANPAVVPINSGGVIARGRGRRSSVCQVGLLPVDPWAPSIDSQSVTSLLFALSLFPYIGFLYFITKSNTAPKLTRFGFYFLLVFVVATIPEGIYAKVQYGTSLANIDLLHGGAESLLTLTNLFIVLGLRQALRKASDADKKVVSAVEEENESSIQMDSESG